MDNVKLTTWFTAHDLPFVLGPPTAFVFGPNAFLNGVFRSGGSRNVSKTADPELDRLIDAQQAELKDASKRRQILHQIQRRIIELGAMTPIFAPVDLTVTYPQMRGIFAGRTNEPAYYDEVWFDQ
jgi:ABC-type oligopeptide transport system substrate-binding subunit